MAEGQKECGAEEGLLVSQVDRWWSLLGLRRALAPVCGRPPLAVAGALALAVDGVDGVVWAGVGVVGVGYASPVASPLAFLTGACPGPAGGASGQGWVRACGVLRLRQEEEGVGSGQRPCRPWGVERTGNREVANDG